MTPARLNEEQPDHRVSEICLLETGDGRVGDVLTANLEWGLKDLPTSNALTGVTFFGLYSRVGILTGKSYR